MEPHGYDDRLGLPKNGDEMDPSAYLVSYPQWIRIKVKTGEHAESFMVNHDLCIGHLRVLVARRFNIELKHTCLIFAGRMLTDADNLLTLSVLNGYTILLVVRDNNSSSNTSNNIPTSILYPDIFLDFDELDPEPPESVETPEAEEEEEEDEEDQTIEFAMQFFLHHQDRNRSWENLMRTNGREHHAAGETNAASGSSSAPRRAPSNREDHRRYNFSATVPGLNLVSQLGEAGYEIPDSPPRSYALPDILMVSRENPNALPRASAPRHSAANEAVWSSTESSHMGESSGTQSRHGNRRTRLEHTIQYNPDPRIRRTPNMEIIVPRTDEYEAAYRAAFRERLARLHAQNPQRSRRSNDLRPASSHYSACPRYVDRSVVGGNGAIAFAGLGARPRHTSNGAQGARLLAEVRALSLVERVSRLTLSDVVSTTITNNTSSVTVNSRHTRPRPGISRIPRPVPRPTSANVSRLPSRLPRPVSGHRSQDVLWAGDMVASRQRCASSMIGENRSRFLQSDIDERQSARSVTRQPLRGNVNTHINDRSVWINGRYGPLESEGSNSQNDYNTFRRYISDNSD